MNCAENSCSSVVNRCISMYFDSNFAHGKHPLALKNQHGLDVKIHSRTLLPTQAAHPKGWQIVHESFQERFDEPYF